MEQAKNKLEQTWQNHIEFYCTAAEQAGVAWGGECLLGKVALHVRRIHSLHVRRRQLRTVDLGLFSDLFWLTVMFGLKVA